MLNGTDVAFVGTVTGFCGWTDASLLATNTCWPGEYAGASSVTVPTTVCPLVTLVPFTVNAVTERGWTDVSVKVVCTVVVAG